MVTDAIGGLNLIHLALFQSAWTAPVKKYRFVKGVSVMSASKYYNSVFGTEKLEHIKTLAEEVATKIDGKIPYSFSETVTMGEYSGETFKGWVLKILTDDSIQNGKFSDEIIHKTNIIFLCNDGIISLCEKESREHDVFAGNQLILNSRYYFRTTQ